MSEKVKSTIAVVDKSNGWVEAMCDLLEMNGMVGIGFLVLGNDRELVNQIDSRVPDLVITGARTDKSGLNLATNLRQLGYSILVMSDPHYQKAIEEAGFPFLDKMTEASVIIATIREILAS